MKKITNGRPYYHLPKVVILGTSIIPIFESRLYHEQVEKNTKALANYLKRKETNKDARKEIVELRVEYVTFEKEKKQSFEDAYLKHQEKVLQILSKYNKEYDDRSFEQAFAKDDVKISSKTVEFGAGVR